MRLPPPHKEKRHRRRIFSSPSLPKTSSLHPLLSLLELCSTIRQLKQIQAQMVLSAIISDPFAASRLVVFCTVSDDTEILLPYCSEILAGLDNPNTFSWNVAIRGFSENMCPKESISLYKMMLRSEARPDSFTHPFLFRSCAGMMDHVLGNSVFAHVLLMGLTSFIHVCNAAIHMLAVRGVELEEARKLFDESPVRDLVTWNTIITAFAQCGRPLQAFDLYEEMRCGSIKPDAVTMIGLVSCCAQLQDLELGRKFHCYAEENRLEFTVPLTNALIDMYIKCGSLEPAFFLFESMASRSRVSWTTMISGYARFGLIQNARKLFDEMPDKKDVVPWNALITGYAQCQRAKEALALFNEMQACSEVNPDEVTMVGVLSACCQLGALETGVWVHLYVEKHKLHLNAALGTALVDMYAKCGNIAKSLIVFKDIAEKNALTWTAIICGLASHGHAEDAIRYFTRMLEEGLTPDGVTFIGALSACCHAGLVEQGRIFFALMQSKYKLSPSLKHYSCLVDLLGRAGLLLEAEELVNAIPMVPDEVVWGALFFAARIHGNVSVGERAALRLLELVPHDSGIYVMLASMYAEANMRNESTKVRLLMKDQGVEKTPGCSLIEVDGFVSEFIVRDRSHPESERIYSCLIELSGQLHHRGSMPSLFPIDFG